MRELGSLLRRAAISTLVLPLLALDCSDTSGPSASDNEPPPITELPGVYTADMTFERRTGGSGGCPDEGHQFIGLVLNADPAAGSVTVQFAFPVTGSYEPSTGAYAGTGRTDSSLTGFELELTIDGVFVRDRNEEDRIVLTGEATIGLLSKATGVEFCRTRLGLRMERIGA